MPEWRTGTRFSSENWARYEIIAQRAESVKAATLSDKIKRDKSKGLLSRIEQLGTDIPRRLVTLAGQISACVVIVALGIGIIERMQIAAHAALAGPQSVPIML